MTKTALCRGRKQKRSKWGERKVRGTSAAPDFQIPRLGTDALPSILVSKMKRSVAILMTMLKDFAINFLYYLINTLEFKTKDFLQGLKFKVLEMKQGKGVLFNEEDFGHFRLVFRITRFMFKFPWLIMYWIYIAPALFALRVVGRVAKLFLGRWWKNEHKNRLVRFLVNHLESKYEQIMAKLLSSRLSELFTSCFGTCLEIAILLIWPFTPTSEGLPTEKVMSEQDLAELVEYEEFEMDEAALGPYRRSFKMMHNAVSFNLFKATIRPFKSSDALSEVGGALIARPVENIGTDSPASFPASPFSREFVKNKSSERTVSLIFAARDRIRLETQSVSKDEYSRRAAQEAQSSGQYAIFDPKQSCGIAFDCGNHCAVKVGKAQCCSCRSMVAVRPNTFVYFEFSVMVSSAAEPVLAVGLSPPDCPLNVMVGQWQRSIGVCSDGNLFIGRHWLPCPTISASSTVGMLVHLPGPVKETTAPPELTAPQEESAAGIVCNFNVNGVPMVFPAAAMAEPLKELTLLNAPLYPTVSLLSEETRVYCRFCEADIIYRSRESIGAPKGVRVYGLDGSLVLDETE